MRFIDVEEMFELNPDMKIETTTLEDGINVIEIDNFYRNPELILQFADNVPIPKNFESSTIGNPTYYYSQIDFFSKLHMKKISDIATELMNIHPSYCMNGEYLTHKVKELMLHFRPAVIDDDVGYYPPHQDDPLVTALVYLSKNDERGTLMYRHKKSGLTYYPKSMVQTEYYHKAIKQNKYSHDFQVGQYVEDIMKMLKEDNWNQPVLQDNDRWEIIYKTSGKFNSAVIFPSAQLHSPNVEKNCKKERIIQTMYLE